MPFPTLITKSWQGMYQWNRWWVAWRRKRWAEGEVDVAKLLIFHQRPTTLYVCDIVVRSRMLNQSAIHAWWITIPASSRPLLLTWSSWLPQDTSWDMMSAGKCAYHTIGCAPMGSGAAAVALVCYWGVLGTALGPCSTAPPHIYPKAL